MENNRCTCAVKLRKLSFHGNWMFTGYWGNGVMRRGLVREGILRKGRGWSGNEVSDTPEEGKLQMTTQQHPVSIQSTLTRMTRAGRGQHRSKPLATGVMSMFHPKISGWMSIKWWSGIKTVSGRPGPLLHKFIFLKITEGSYSLNTVFPNYHRKNTQQLFVEWLSRCTNGR